VTLAQDRYVALLDALVEVARAPQFVGEPSRLAHRSGRAIFVDIAREAWRCLTRAVDTLAPDASDDAYLALWDLSQRARYAVETVAPLNGRDARRFARGLADVQSVLGDLQATRAAEAWFRKAAKALPSARLVAGELIAFERTDRVQLRARFWKVWKKTSRRKLRTWLG
jgi:CHAD domain-containing protein